MCCRVGERSVSDPDLLKRVLLSKTLLALGSLREQLDGLLRGVQSPLEYVSGV